MKIKDYEEMVRYLTNYKFKTKPYKHQIKALEKSVDE